MFIELAARDLELREQLIKEGKLFGDYNSDMEALHIANGKILEHYLVEHGWPIDPDESAAAWLVLMHAISLPKLQRAALKVLQAQSIVEPWRVAMLEDIVFVFSGKKQTFGTQWDWDANGEMQPYAIYDPNAVDALRASVDLEPLDSVRAGVQERIKKEGDSAPKDRPAYLKKRLDWMIRVGWITSIDEVDPSYLI